MLLLPVVGSIVEDVELVSVVVARGMLLGVVRCWCFCLVTGLVFVMRVSSDLAVIRKARNVAWCGVWVGRCTVIIIMSAKISFCVS